MVEEKEIAPRTLVDEEGHPHMEEVPCKEKREEEQEQLVVQAPLLDEAQVVKGEEKSGGESIHEEASAEEMALGQGEERMEELVPVEEEDFSEERDPVRALILGKMQQRAARAAWKLRSNFSGVLELKLKDRKESFSFDWSGERVKVSEGTSKNAECTISMHSECLLDVARGRLNPQICMLSDKIQVAGKSSSAVYFFNLAAPQRS